MLPVSKAYKALKAQSNQKWISMFNCVYFSVISQWYIMECMSMFYYSPNKVNNIKN